MVDEPRLEEEAISKAVEIGLSSQLDEVEKIDVDIQTDLLKIAQGKVDSVGIFGQGIVTQKDIRVQEIEVHAASIELNLLSALFGQIELNNSVNTNARIVLTEQDINRALNSDYVHSKMQNLELNVDGQPVNLELQQMELFLPGNSKMQFNAKTLLRERDKTRSVSFTAVARPRTSSQPVMLESFQCTQGEGISLEVIVPLMQKLKELVNLPYFELEKTVLRIKEMEVQAGSLTLYVDAWIRASS